MPTTALRSRFWSGAASVFLLSSALLIAGLGLVGLRGAGMGPGLPLFAVCSAVPMILAVRVLFVGVYVSRDHLIVRELLRTKRVPWESIEGVRLTSREPETFGTPTFATPMPQILYRRPDGRPGRLAVTSLGARRVSVAQRNVEALTALIHTRGR